MLCMHSKILFGRLHQNERGCIIGRGRDEKKLSNAYK